MSGPTYFMESEEESLRLDIKTDPGAVEEQARWAGVVPGMRVVDLGCGAGRTTHILHRLVQPGGEVVGIDHSQPRIDYAVEHYSENGIFYVLRLGFRPFPIWRVANFTAKTRRNSRRSGQAQHFLNLAPLPQGQGSLRPTLATARSGPGGLSARSMSAMSSGWSNSIPRM